MPSYYALPAAFGADTVEDVDKFQMLPFYLVKNEARKMPVWDIWGQLYGDIDWSPNVGNIMRGVRPEPSPVGEVFFFPGNVTTVPNKNIYETGESISEARVKWHRYESKQFSFLPSFKDFYKNRIEYNHTDLMKQIKVSDNMFIRTNVFHKSPNVILAGGPSLTFTEAPSGDGSADFSTAKSSAWIVAIAPLITQGLTIKVLDLACNIMAEDLQVPYFEGTKNVPRPNDLMKGKYVVIGETQAFQQLKWDPSIAQLKSADMDLIFDQFHGSLFGTLTYRFDPYQIRFNADGTFPVPQIVNQTTGKVRPNPDWVKALFGVAFLCGADAYRSIKVGPPPAEFAERSMDQKKFYSMKWNGEIQLTDQVIITYADGTIDLNVYGTQLKFISQLTHGIMPLEPLNCVPILYKRTRQAVE